MIKRRLAVALFVLIAHSVLPAAAAVDGSDAVDACYSHASGVPVAGTRACRSGQAFVYGGGRLCRFAGVGAQECASVDGRLVSAQLVDQFEGSWVPRALALQRGLDGDLPLQEQLWVHTHNSFNAEAYNATLSGLDPNQVYSLSDQLRMGVRALEVDVHWAPSAEAEAGDSGQAPIVCHGEQVPIGPVTAHFGCTAEVHLRTRLTEIRSWLSLPSSADELVMIYLENNLDDNPVAHDRASETIDEVLGDLVFRPGSSSCTGLPMDTSRSAIAATGKRVILTGNCGPGAWNSWVFERGSRWIEAGSPPGIDYPDYPACLAARAASSYSTNWIRHFEDSTWLSAMLTGSGIGRTSETPPEEVRRMVRCGVNMIGLDQLRPYDPKLEALVWSWAPDEPSVSAPGACAFSDASGRMRADSCETARPVACLTAGEWFVTGTSHAFAEAASACAAAGGSFAVPRTGFANEGLIAAKGSSPAWIDYSFDAGRWSAGGPLNERPET